MSNKRPGSSAGRTRHDDLFDVDEAALHEATMESIRDDQPSSTSQPTPSPGEADGDTDNTEASMSGGDAGPSEDDTAAAAANDPVTPDGDGHPYIRITPAREQVTPSQVVNGLFGFYRAGQGRSLPLALEQHLPFVTPRSTFEFLIHKPRDARRFDFYIGVHPYQPTAFTNLASNLSAMYPGAFTFEIVSFAPAAAFEPDESVHRGAEALADREGIDDLEGFEQFDIAAPSHGLADGGVETATASDASTTASDMPTDPPAMARWVGVETKSNDYMTLLSRFTEVTPERADEYRSPLSVLLEQAVGTEAPFLYQVVWTPRPDWTKAAEKRKRNLKLGYEGTIDAFFTELVMYLTGRTEEDRRQRHRPSTPEQIGGTIRTRSGDNAAQMSRMEQIDVKQPAATFDVSIRAAGSESVINSCTGALNALGGPYYGLTGDYLGEDRSAFKRLCNAELTRSIWGRIGDTNPLLVASPDELANFVTVPHTAALPQASRGASGGTPDARSPLTATDEELLAAYDTGMYVGNAETAPPSRENIPIHLTASQMVQHVLRTGTTGSGKTTALINDALSAYEAFDGPIFMFDKKGGSLCAEYKRAHFARFGDLDDVIHLPVPGPNGEVPAFPLFDIRPHLAAGMPRETAVQEKIDRFNELLRYVVGDQAHEQAFVAREILNSLIEALFDPVKGSDAFEIRDLLDAAHAMMTSGVIPEVSDDDLKLALKRHFESDDYRFETSIDAVMNRLTKLRERDFVWRVLNFVPEWDPARQRYATDQMLFDLDTILDSTKVVLLDPGDLRPQSRNLFSVLVLDYIWARVRLRQRWETEVPTPAEGYLINLVIDEAAPIMQTDLVRNEMIQDAREFALSFEIIVHFAEQVKQDTLDTSAYKEVLRNFNTKLIGKLGIDQELARVLFHEDLDVDELFDRATSMPRGEVVAQLPDTGFMTDTPELVTLRPLDIPSGHSDSDTPVDAETESPTAPITFGKAAQRQWDHSRLSYCLIPGVNSTRKSAAQRAAADAQEERNGDDAPSTVEAAPDQSADEDEETPAGDEADASEASASDSSGDASAPDAKPEGGDGATSDPATTAGSEAPTVDGDEDNEGRNRGGGRGATVPPAGSSQTDAASERDSPGADQACDTTAEDESGDNTVADTPPPPGQTPSDGATVTETDPDLTEHDRTFLKNIILLYNDEIEGYDLTDKMTHIRNLSGSRLNEERLIDKGYLTVYRVHGRKFYWVTDKGQELVPVSLATGPKRGDPHEKVQHKVSTAYFARYLEDKKDLAVEKYISPTGGGMVFDVAGFTEQDDGTKQLSVIGEVTTTVKPERVVKHYTDFTQFDHIRKVWVVRNFEVAHDLVRALHNKGYIDTVPWKSIHNYTKITQKAFGSTDKWLVMGIGKIIERLEHSSPSSEGQ